MGVTWLADGQAIAVRRQAQCLKWRTPLKTIATPRCTPQRTPPSDYQIVLPVDCVPGSSLHEEQSTVWSLINGPGTARVLTATTLDAILLDCRVRPYFLHALLRQPTVGNGKYARGLRPWLLARSLCRSWPDREATIHR